MARLNRLERVDPNLSREVTDLLDDALANVTDIGYSSHAELIKLRNALNSTKQADVGRYILKVLRSRVRAEVENFDNSQW